MTEHSVLLLTIHGLQVLGSNDLIRYVALWHELAQETLADVRG